MFFDTLESRQMFSATLHHAVHIPTKREAAIAISRHSKPIQSVAKAPKVSAAAARVAAQNRALVTAVFDAETRVLEDVITGELKTLVRDVEDVKFKAAKAGGQLQALLGSTVAVGTSLPGNTLEALQGTVGTIDHVSQLLGSPLKQLTGDRNSQLSDDPPAASDGSQPTQQAKGWWQSIVDFFSSDKPKSGVDTGANAGLDAAMEKVGPPAGGEAVTILRAPAFVQSVTGDARDFLNGFIAVVHSGDKDPRMPDANGNLHNTPTPSDIDNGGSGIITAADIKAIAAKLNAASTPTGDDSKGNGGALNTGVNGTGNLNSKATFTQDAVSTRVSISARDLASLAVRLTSKITIVR